MDEITDEIPKPTKLKNRPKLKAKCCNCGKSFSTRSKFIKICDTCKRDPKYRFYGIEQDGRA